MPQPYTNRFGRRPGRGIRPFLLFPKVASVALYIGALAADILLFRDFPSIPPSDPRRLWTLSAVSRLLTHLAIPALVSAMFFGLLLFLQHPRQFIRLRWLITKIVILAALIPTAHTLARSRMSLLRQDATQGLDLPQPAHQLALILLAVLLLSLLIAFLGRIKPRNVAWRR